MLKTIEAQMFKTPAALQAFLTQSGETNEDLLYRVRIETLRDKLQTKITGAKVTITPAEIAAYYKQNSTKPPLSTPETRDLRVVLVKSLGLAVHVRALIAGGQSIGTVARKFSIDQATKARGGALIGVKKGDEEQALDAKIFGAASGSSSARSRRASATRSSACRRSRRARRSPSPRRRRRFARRSRPTASRRRWPLTASTSRPSG